MIKTAIVACALIGFGLIGCASIGTGNGGTQKLAAARLVARDAGRVVAINNPALAETLSAVYVDLGALTGEKYKAGFTSSLNEFLAAQGVQGNEALREDAKDLLALFGFDVHGISIPDLVGRVDEAIIRDIVSAFFQGLCK